MKYVFIGVMVWTALSCKPSTADRNSMREAKIIELVMWRSIEGLSMEEAKNASTKLNDFVRKQPGFVGRTTALAEEGKFLDLVYWTDLKSAQSASEKAMASPELIPIFSTIDQREMVFQHFEIFNRLQ